MAITTLKLWMAPESNRLLSGPNSFSPAADPVFYEGNTARIELHILAGAGIGKIPYEVPFPAGASIKLAVGQVNAFPTSGNWQLYVDGVQTAEMPFNATPAQLQTALNALAPVQASGGVICAANGDGYTVTWNTFGTKPDIGIGSDTLVPSSYESISLVQQGTADVRKVVYIELRQAPVALGVDWDPLPAPAMSVVEITAWNGATQTWRFGIDPAPKAGSYNLTIAGASTKTYNFSASATAENITTKVAADFPNAKAYKTGEAQFDIVFNEEVTLTADGNGLIGYLGYIGNVNFSTSEIHQFIGGLEGRQTTLEVAIEAGGIPQTLIQVRCFVSSDVISNGVLQPLPLGTAMSEQVANARFVRRDLDQNPDAATQDIIWQNLGVETLGSDVTGALNAADSPSAANPFATISDIPTVTSAVWGQITGDIANQSDLDYALTSLDNLKYDKSNPAGYIDGSALVGYATESWVQSQGYIGTSGGVVYGSIQILGQNSNSTTVNLGSISIVDEPSMYGSSTASFGTGGFGASQAIFPNFPSVSLNPGSGLTIVENNNTTVVNNGVLTYNGVEPYATTSSVTSQISALANDVNLYYVQKNNAVFPSKATFTSVGGQAGLNIGIGGTSTSALTNGDLWITTGGTNLNFRDGTGSWRILVNTSNTNSFSAPQIIDTTSSTPALRITQKGVVSGQSRAIVVEDETSPDQNCFIIDQSGNVGVGVSNDPVTPWVAGSSKVEVVGNIKSTTLSTGAGPAFSVNSTSAHTGGTDTLDLIVTIGGVNYRIGLRPA